MHDAYIFQLYTIMPAHFNAEHGRLVDSYYKVAIYFCHSCLRRFLYTSLKPLKDIQ
jgi:hypothetical protein